MPDVSAIVVTRGDVPVKPILDSWPHEWEQIVWDNGAKVVSIGNHEREEPRWYPAEDLAVYGRYAAIEHASHDLIYVQDDDCIVSDPQAIVEAYSSELARQGLAGPGKVRRGGAWLGRNGVGRNFLVANQPGEFRHSFYEDHCLVGFGAVFHRDAPMRAFKRLGHLVGEGGFPANWPENFLRTCDIVFTALTPRVLVDMPLAALAWATHPNRMYHQPDHVGSRSRMLKLALQVRDGS